MTTEFGPCTDWPVRFPCDVACVSPEATGSAVKFATDIVWGLSGRQFGTCDVTVRPCRRTCADTPWGWAEIFPGNQWIQPTLFQGQWFNVICGSCQGDNCSCSSVSEVVLPGPVSKIVQVKIDGTPLVTGSYRVDDNRFLVRTDGNVWPLCNDLNKADTQVGTWSVTASFGRAVPEGGQWAVGELACEIFRAINGEDCRLPRNVTQLARQGVTISYPDMNALFDKGRTGLYLTDLFIATWNPNGLHQPSRTYSIDTPRARRTGT